MKTFFFSFADSFIPPSVVDPEEIRRLRAAIFQSWLGIGLTATFGGLYTLLGSPLSGVSILFLMVALLLVPSLIKRGTSVFWLAHLLVGGTWLSTWLVSWRSGGFTSPAVVWNFMLPLSVYSVCGKRSAFVWSALSAVQILFFFVAQVVDHPFPQDFDDATLAILRISGYAGVVLATVAVLLVVESAHSSAIDAKQQAQRALDRQRILDDMHDGVGRLVDAVCNHERNERSRCRQRGHGIHQSGTRRGCLRAVCAAPDQRHLLQ